MTRYLRFVSADYFEKLLNTRAQAGRRKHLSIINQPALSVLDSTQGWSQCSALADLGVRWVSSEGKFSVQSVQSGRWKRESLCSCVKYLQYLIQSWIDFVETRLSENNYCYLAHRDLSTKPKDFIEVSFKVIHLYTWEEGYVSHENDYKSYRLDLSRKLINVTWAIVNGSCV